MDHLAQAAAHDLASRTAHTLGQKIPPTFLKSEAQNPISVAQAGGQRQAATGSVSCHLSNFDQTAAGLLAIIVSNGKIWGGQGYLTQKEETMIADQLKGIWMQFIGELKQRWGKFTNDDLQRIEGSFDKILGQLQQRYGENCVTVVQEYYGEKKEELMKRAAQWHQRSQQEATKGKMR
jgi:uncharacterized protein YjbJ (UPF0337 family)